MALRDRVHSIETEYAIAFYNNSGQRPGPGTIVDVLMDAVSESHGIPSSAFLVNGSRLAHDVGHAEWGLPECRSGYEAAVYDKASDHLFLHSVVPMAEKRLLQDGYVGKLVVAKNNADSFGATYGCHENYQMQRNAELLGEVDFLRYMAHSLIPFLVSRTILCGSGRLAMDRGLGPQRLRYEISQRAGFIQTVVSRDTTRARPIFNLGREGESFASGNNRRLHLILGDATLSGWATWIKLGSTGLMLRLVEDMFLDDAPALTDPVAAIKSVSRDLSGQAMIPLQNGGQISALDLQWFYYDQADSYLNVFGASEEDEDLMEAWGAALEDFGRDPLLLRDRADWAIKKHMLDSYLQQNGYAWDRLPTSQQAIADLQAFDLRFHELSPDGLYHRLYPADTLVSADEIAYAQDYPPPFTRARIRGEAIRLSRECGLHVRTDSWTSVSIEEDHINISQPMDFDHRQLAGWDHPWQRLDRLITEEEGENKPYNKLGRYYQNLGLHQKALLAFRTAAENTPEDLDVVHDLARAYLLMGRYPDAITWFEKYNHLADRISDRDTHDYSSMGYVYRQMGDYAKAMQMYRKANQGTSSSKPLANRGMAMVYLMQGDLDSAVTYFEKSVQHTPERQTSCVVLGAIYYSRGQIDRAKPMFQQAVNLQQHRALLGLVESTIRYLRAVAKVGLEHTDALSALQRALKTQTAEAMDGIRLAKMLLGMLAQTSSPPRDAQAALALVEPIQPAMDPPDQHIELPPMPARHLDWLGKGLNHPNAEVRARALEYFGWHFDDTRQTILSSLLPVVLDKAHHDPDAKVRRAAVQTLGELRTLKTEIMDDLIQCLQDSSPAVQWAAQLSLEQLHLPLQPAPAAPAPVEFGLFRQHPPVPAPRFREPLPEPSLDEGLDDWLSDISIEPEQT
ncbi:MAG: proteasome accessory factor PafA2 family protein [Chloroflexi bacterium]|nr:proteasome accessory factor PafA2 family protein [Chloroflexota bacterium]